MNAAPATPTHGLRPGQQEALERWRDALNAGSRSELVVVPVGYGKTVIGAGSFGVAQRAINVDTCLYLTPTDVLRRQVYDGFERAATMGGYRGTIRKILAENSTAHRIAATNANLVVASYQQVASSPGPYIALCRARRVHIVCDEAHHLGERGRWSAALAELPAVSSVLLSATPVRLDRDAIAGARYVENDEGDLVIEPLVEVSMRQAWKERRILKHLNLQMKDYQVHLQDAEGNEVAFTASEMAELPDFDQQCVREQLRWNDDYLAPLVREFATALQAKQRMMPGQHQGLVFAATTEHANHLQRAFALHHPSLRTVVVHSGADLTDAENANRMRQFHAGKADVLIQVKKASEGFDAPTVSVLLKLDAIHSRGPVIQQLGRGLRFNMNLSEEQNVLNVFIGRDPRMQSMIDYLERETPPVPIARLGPGDDSDELREQDAADDELGDELEEDEDRPQVRDVTEVGDFYVDHNGRPLDGQQLTMFGVPAPQLLRQAALDTPAVEVVDLDKELNDAIRFCTDWTNRAARARAAKRGTRENHHKVLNAIYGKLSGKRGSLSTPAEYRQKGDWMKKQYAELLD